MSQLQRRSHGGSPLPRPHFVYCEGRTEADCISKFRQHFRIPAVSVTVVDSVGTPATIMRRATEKWRTTRAAGAYVYAVFDRDAFPCFDASVAQLASKPEDGVFGGISVPCFELWGLILLTDQTAYIERDRAQARLSELMPSYHHERHPYLDFPTALAGYAEASRRADVLAARAGDAGDPYNNPTTTFPNVLREIFGGHLAPAE
ncbi:MAG: RloB domain-containing protein [Myxococcales bacterium]|nr:RloB domain-containing protein [Myxococcales bacterium]MCB9519989.1 RloB domain-containing protein [Myxococcales bacterium]MCB9532427.1 RloB domain-containing protein [Myxococcales bacterium]MCB9534348.1 RloB domain-containing protein [Myxococcales bacterium]